MAEDGVCVGAANDLMSGLSSVCLLLLVIVLYRVTVYCITPELGDRHQPELGAGALAGQVGGGRHGVGPHGLGRGLLGGMVSHIVQWLERYLTHSIITKNNLDPLTFLIICSDCSVTRK